MTGLYGNMGESEKNLNASYCMVKHMHACMHSLKLIQLLCTIICHACSDGSTNTAYMDSSASEHTFVTILESVITANKSVSTYTLQQYHSCGGLLLIY